MPEPCRCGAEDCPRCRPLNEEHFIAEWQARESAEELADYLIDQRKDDEMTEMWEVENG